VAAARRTSIPDASSLSERHIEHLLTIAHGIENGTILPFPIRSDLAFIAAGHSELWAPVQIAVNKLAAQCISINCSLHRHRPEILTENVLKACNISAGIIAVDWHNSSDIVSAAEQSPVPVIDACVIQRCLVSEHRKRHSESTLLSAGVCVWTALLANMPTHF
jgi:hypothetical protein